MRRGYADGPTGQIHYLEAGEGETIVLLHQTASSGAMWERNVPQLTERHRVVAPDNPGFGLSDKPESPPEIADYSAAVLAILDALEVESAHIVGFHTGATIAVDLAAHHPERTRSVVLVGILAPESDEERDYWRETIINPWEADGKGEFLQKHVEFLGSYLPEDDGELFLAELIARLQAGGDYWWAYDAILRHPTYELLGRIERPALVVNPIDDLLYEGTKTVHAALATAAYAEIPGGVQATSEHPEAFSAAVLEFVDGLAGGETE